MTGNTLNFGILLSGFVRLIGEEQTKTDRKISSSTRSQGLPFYQYLQDGLLFPFQLSTTQEKTVDVCTDS